MESISLDASLNLPTIDPARIATNPPDTHRRFDDELRRASFPTLEERNRAREANKKEPTSNNDSARHDESAATASTDNDSSDDDSIVNKNSDDAAGVNAAQDTSKTDTADQPDKQEDSATTDAAAAAAVSPQSVSEKAVLKPTNRTGAEAQPDRIDAVQDLGHQNGNSPAKTTPVAATDVANTTIDTSDVTTDTPDVIAEKVTAAVAVSKLSELHATATALAKTGAADNVANPEAARTEATGAQPTPAATTATPTEATAPVVEDHDDRRDKKQHSARPHATAADDAKLDVALADKAKSQLQTGAADAVSNPTAQAAADAAAEIEGSAAGAHLDDGQKTTAGAATPQAAETTGKHGAAPSSVTQAGPTATQKLLDGTARTSPRGGDNASEVDRARFVQRVSKAFQTASERGGPLRLRLNPPELGSVRVEVSIRGGVMSARMEAETTTAQSMLLDNLPALRERLAQHNIKIERFDVDLLGQPGDGSQQSPTDTSDRQAARTAPSVQQRRNATVAVEDKSTAAPSRRTSGSGQLNVII